MPFGRMSVKKWAAEWRESDWRETVPLSSGRECPRPGCKATICGGKAWRDHWAGHDRDDARLAAMDTAIRRIALGLRELAIEAGHSDWFPDLAEEDAGEGQEGEPVTGYVLGNGPLPEEMRGGGE